MTGNIMEDPFDHLLKALLDKSQPIPVDQLDDLSDLEPEKLESLKTAWEKIHFERRRELLEILGREALNRIEVTFEAINRLAMLDPDAEVRRRAIENLWESQDPQLTSSLLTLLKDDPEEQVRVVAATTLGTFVWLGEIEEIPSTLLHLVEEGLLAAINADDSDEVSRRALEAIGFSSHEEVPGLIDQAYKTGEEHQVQSAIFAMGRSASKEWSDIIQIELVNPSPKIRLESVRAAGELEIREATESIIELLEDVDEDVRDAAIWALGQLGGEDAADALIFLLDTTDDEMLAEYVEESLDHLAFVDGTRDFLLIDIDEPDEPKDPPN
jgi:HEAT repeat protein